MSAMDNIVGYEVIEFKGRGDPYFGGTADDRPLGTNGRYLTARDWNGGIRPAHFETRESAQRAGEAAPRRPHSLLGVIPIRNYATAGVAAVQS